MAEETISEILNKKSQAESELASLQVRLADMEQDYNRLKTVKARIEDAITNMLSVAGTEDVFLEGIQDSDWQGEKRNWHEVVKTCNYQESVCAIYNAAVVDLNAIEDKIREMEQSAETINSEINRLTRNIERYSRQISRRE